ncbi:hypothetical protein TcWFU_005373 [Taenia crassiceps]|uniref:Ribosome association toxin RatA n=1 Tax=Taenia crassiceps TaxID=6207 RepID=A0ABR4QL18_9CEST
MQSFYLTGVLLLVTLLPVSILAHGSTVHSIIDSILKDAPEYLVANVEKTQVQSVQSLVRSCAFSFYETLLDGEIIYTLSTCINATKLKITPPSQPLLLARYIAVEIGRTKLDLSAQIRKGIRLDFKVDLSAPVFDDAYAYVWIFPVPVGWFKDLIIRDARKRIESELRSFLPFLE